MATNIAEKAILLSDFADIESKTLVEKELFARIKPKIGSWRSRCYTKALQAPYKTATFRSVVFPKAKDEQDYILLEGIKPDPTGKLTFVEQIMSVEPRGFYATYTDADMAYGFDPIVPLLTQQIEGQANDVLDQIAAKAYLSGNNVYVANSGLTREVFNAIRISLKKFTRDKSAKVVAVLTPEDIAELRLKYNAGGSNLFQDLSLNKDSVVDGVLYRFEGVDIEEDDSPFMYQVDPTTGSLSTKKRYAFFRIKDSEGREPVGFIEANGESGTFIEKPLGAGGASENPLNQVGSIGVKFRGLGALITAEECLVRVEITAANIDTVNSGYDDFGNITANGSEVERNNVVGVKSSPKQLTVSYPNTLSVKVGSKLKLKVFNADGEDITSSATWTSGTTSVATISAGVVTGVAAGVSVITVKEAASGLEAKVSVTVTAA